MSVFSDIPIRSNADAGSVDASWWNTIRSALISAFPSGGGSIVTGTRAAPTQITAAGGITAASTDELQFLAGSSGAVTITANPQISAGTSIGQKLKLVGRDNTNTVTLADGNGLSLNGGCILAADCILNLFWDGTNWVEEGRDIKG